MGMADRIKEAVDNALDGDGRHKSKAQIARECDVSAGALSQWLSGETKSLKADTALALEQATGYRAAWILSGKLPKRTTEPERVWPFPKIPLERFEALDQDDRGYVQRELLQAIARCEQSVSPPPPLAPVPTDTAAQIREPESAKVTFSSQRKAAATKRKGST